MRLSEDNEIIESDYRVTEGTIHVYHKGSGSKNVVLIHGSGCDCAMLSWKEVIKCFPKDYNVYAIDLFGYGKSSRVDDLCGKDFYDRHIKSVKETVDLIGLNDFVLAGLSMGGSISIGFALKYPEKVKLLMPVDSWGLSKKLPLHKLSYWMMNNTDFTLKQNKWTGKYRWMAKWAISYSLIGDKSKITDEIIDEVMYACRENGAGKSMQDYQRSSCTKEGAIPYYGEKLKELKMNVWFVNGEKDALVPLKNAEAASKLVKDGKLFILKGCKHWAPKERPQEFVGIIEKYYEENGDGKATR